MGNNTGFDLREILIGEMCTKNLLTIYPTATVAQLIKLILDNDYRRVPIVDQGKIAGIITISDVLKALVSGKNTKLESTKIQEVMTHDVISLHADANLDTAVQKMGREDRGNLIVVNEKYNSLLGIITEWDVIKLLKDVFGDLKIKDLPERYKQIKLLTLNENANISQAMSLMLDKGIKRSIMITDDNKVKGIITASDIIRHICTKDMSFQLDMLKNPVSMVNDAKRGRELISVNEDSLLADAISLIIRHKFDAVPISDAEDRILGVISTSAIIFLLQEQYHKED